METEKQKETRCLREKEVILQTFKPDKELLDEIRHLPACRQVAILRTIQVMLVALAVNEKRQGVTH